MTSIERLMELESLPAETDGPKWMARGAAGVRFEGVSFEYPGSHGTRVLDAFSYDFRPGTLTVVAARSKIPPRCSNALAVMASADELLRLK